MAPSVSNTAKTSVESDESVVEEPSMEEILASIKQIIDDDEQPEDGLTPRERYSHPADHSNSNDVENDVAENDEEEQLRLAMEAEMLQMSGADEMDVPEQDAEPVGEATVPSKPEIEERAAKILSEVGSTSQGMSSDERLEAYRVRSKHKMEALAEERARQVKAARPARPAKRANDTKRPVAPVNETKSEVPEAPVTMEAPKLLPPALRPAVAQPFFTPFQPQQAGVILPTSQTIASELAEKMITEKGDDLRTQLLELMRPAIRQWLSDNLPSLVERLVREEIERVSRGKRAS